MRRIRFTYAPYCLPLKRPLTTARGSLNERQGMLLALTDESGACGLGESAPWPEFGTETQAELESHCKTVAARISSCSLPEDIHAIQPWLAQLGLSQNSQPTLCFGLECAATALIARRSRTALHTLLKSDSPAQIEVNGFASLNSPSLIDDILILYRSGVSTVKMKVGTASIHADLEKLQAVRAAYPDIRIRLDANNAWSFDEANEFLCSASSLNIEYLEDPLKHSHPMSLKQLANSGRIPLAVDECFRDDLWRETRIKNGVFSTLILKPALHGVSIRTKKLATLAKDQEMKTVMTSLFDSSVGIAYAAHAAAAFGSSCPHGLNSATLFEVDTIVLPPVVNNGQLTLTDVAGLAQHLRPDLRRALKLD